MTQYNRLVLPAAVALTAGAVLGGCSPNKSQTINPPVHPESTSQAPAVPGTAEAYEQLPWGVCNSPQYASEERAQACLDAYEHGTVAFVNFDALTPDKAQTLATVTQDTLRHASKGILNLTVNVVPASDRAKEALTHNKCVDDKDPTHLAATIAQETMPELAKSTFVVALTAAKPCTPEGGVADPQKSRGADVYVNNATTVDWGSYTAPAHETGHLLGLGHDGFATEANDETYSMPPGMTIDLPQVAKGLKDDVYMSSGITPNPMGAVMATSDKLAFSSPQLNSLEWPYRRLGKQLPKGIDYVEDPDVSLTCEQAAAGQVITADLPNPIFFGDYKPKEDRQSFDELVLTPTAYEQNGTCELAAGVDVSLYDKSSNTIVGLGSADLTDFTGKETPQWTFVAGDKRVTVTMPKDSNSIQFSESNK